MTEADEKRIGNMIARHCTKSEPHEHLVVKDLEGLIEEIYAYTHEL